MVWAGAYERDVGFPRREKLVAGEGYEGGFSPDVIGRATLAGFPVVLIVVVVVIRTFLLALAFLLVILVVIIVVIVVIVIIVEFSTVVLGSWGFAGERGVAGRAVFVGEGEFFAAEIELGGSLS